MLFFLTTAFDAGARLPTSLRGLGLDAGVGYGMLRWHYTNYTFPPFNAGLTRHKFWLQPTVRLHYNFQLLRLDSSLRIRLQPFVGYYTFGGRSATAPDGYKDVYRLRSIEAGLNPTLAIGSRLQVGVAVKGNRILQATEQHFGALGQPDTVARSWTTNQVSYLFKKWSANAGLTARYQWRHFTVTGEAWLGISNLSAIEATWGRVAIRENNVRLLLGYEL